MKLDELLLDLTQFRIFFGERLLNFTKKTISSRNDEQPVYFMQGVYCIFNLLFFQRFYSKSDCLNKIEWTFGQTMNEIKSNWIKLIKHNFEISFDFTQTIRFWVKTMRNSKMKMQ